MFTERPEGMTYKQWKAYKKKMTRKEKRTAIAVERENLNQTNGLDSVSSEDDYTNELEEQERQRQNLLWLERERQAQIQFRLKKEWEEKERIREEEVQKKIREEWEAREKKEREEKEEKERKDQERKDKQEKMLREAVKDDDSESWHNPIAPVQYDSQNVQHCPFFKKTAACRFGDQCSRYHEYPDLSPTILIAGMFFSFELEQSVIDNIDTDVSLEYDDNELYNSFRDFYEDVIPEFKSIGRVVQFKVCSNCEPHLRGNVYIQYKRESDALEAYKKFNARWYGGRQLTCRFVNITSWKSAICGQAFRKQCPKGKMCNFLHVFRNPRGEFTSMDFDKPDDFHRADSHRSYRYRRSRSRSRERSRSFYRSRKSNSRRSRSSSRRRNRKRSKSRSDRHSNSLRRSPKKSRRKRKSGSPEFRRNRKSRSRSPDSLSKNSANNLSENSRTTLPQSSEDSSSSDSGGSSTSTDNSSDESDYEYVEKTKDSLS